MEILVSTLKIDPKVPRNDSKQQKQILCQKFHCQCNGSNQTEANLSFFERLAISIIQKNYFKEDLIKDFTS